MLDEGMVGNSSATGIDVVGDGPLLCEAIDGRAATAPNNSLINRVEQPVLCMARAFVSRASSTRHSSRLPVDLIAALAR
jgi:hypothetical protein